MIAPLRIIHGLRGAYTPPGCVATIGNFDGVHRGHQQLLVDLAREGRNRGLPVTVILFEPQPREFFFPERSPARLTLLPEKLVRLASLPVDWVLVLRFDAQLAELAPEEFIRRILVERLRVRHLIVGDDFRFGRNRTGDTELLRRTGKRLGFSVSATASVTRQGRRISSTWIREALSAGDLATASELLGRSYSVCGRVVHGDKRGRNLGFPTANIALRRKNIPVQGVFAVTISGVATHALPGVANVGTRPTIDGGSQAILETHLFDFANDLYGRRVEVTFHRKLRDERRFATLQKLREQIGLDVVAARAYFAGTQRPG